MVVFGMRIPSVIINKFTKNEMIILKDVRVINEIPRLATDARVPRPQTSGPQNNSPQKQNFWFTACHTVQKYGVRNAATAIFDAFVFRHSFSVRVER